MCDILYILYYTPRVARRTFSTFVRNIRARVILRFEIRHFNQDRPQILQYLRILIRFHVLCTEIYSMCCPARMRSTIYEDLLRNSVTSSWTSRTNSSQSGTTKTLPTGKRSASSWTSKAINTARSGIATISYRARFSTKSQQTSHSTLNVNLSKIFIDAA